MQGSPVAYAACTLDRKEGCCLGQVSALLSERDGAAAFRPRRFLLYDLCGSIYDPARSQILSVL